MSNASVTEEFAKKLAELKEAGGDAASADEIQKLAEEMLAQSGAEQSPDGEALMGELNDLLGTIRSAKTELAALRPDEVKESFIPQATDELDAIIEATAEATNTIMDSAERIEEAATVFAGKVSEGGDAGALVADLQATQSEAVMQIFEACTFQDITGQRITKVISVFKDIETKIDGLVAAFGGAVAADGSKTNVTPEVEITSRREDLLNGPQLRGEGSSQEDVDALLAEFDNK